MAESMSSLRDQLHAKERELESVGNKLFGAAAGASLMKNSVIGMASGAFLGREKDKKAQLERELAQIKTKMSETERKISELKTKLSQLQNNFQNNKARFEANARQMRNTLENQRYSADTPDKVRDLDQQIAKLQSDSTAKEQQDMRTFENEKAAIQREIDSLAL